MDKNLRSQFKSFQRNGYLVIVFGFFGFFIWASIYSLNKGVFGSGFVISKNEKIEIISPVSGLIKNLNKTSGDTVDKDEEIISIKREYGIEDSDIEENYQSSDIIFTDEEEWI